MFDIAFSELVIIAIVALIVIGPEKLPRVARTLGSLVGRMQRYVANVKHDIERELELDDLQKLHRGIRQESQQFKSEIENTIHSSIPGIEHDASAVKAPTGEQTNLPESDQKPDQRRDGD